MLVLSFNPNGLVVSDFEAEYVVKEFFKKNKSKIYSKKETVYFEIATTTLLNFVTFELMNVNIENISKYIQFDVCGEPVVFDDMCGPECHSILNKFTNEILDKILDCGLTRIQHFRWEKEEHLLES